MEKELVERLAIRDLIENWAVWRDARVRDSIGRLLRDAFEGVHPSPDTLM